jgi:hypothetical protein
MSLNIYCEGESAVWSSSEYYLKVIFVPLREHVATLQKYLPVNSA